MLTLNGNIDNAGYPLTILAGYAIGDDGPITVNGVISGSGKLIKDGYSTATLTRDNTYSGVTKITAGKLAVSSDNNLGTVPGTAADNIELDGGLLAATSSFTLNNKRNSKILRTIESGFWADSGVTLTYGGVISASGSTPSYVLRLDGPGTIELSGKNTYKGNTTIFATVVRILNSQALGLTNVTLPSTVLVNNLSTLQLAGGVTVNKILALDLANLVNLTGDNTWSGYISIQINPGGKSVISAAAGTKLTLSGEVAISTQTPEDPVNQFENLYLAGAGDIDITGTISEEISGAGGYILGHGDVVMEGSGTLTLSSDNTYSGRTIMKNGIVSVTGDSNFGAVPAATTEGRLVLSGGTLACDASFTINSNRGIALGSALQSGTGTIQVAESCVVSYAGAFADISTGTGALTKNGAGTLELTGASTYSLGTSVDAGTLRVNNTTGSATGTGKVTVGSGATLAGNGFIGGLTSLKSGGTLSPGNSPGTLTIYTNLVLDSSSIFTVEIDADLSDLAAVTGTCTIASGAVLNVSGTGPTVPVYTIITTTEGVSGTFSGLPEGASVTIDGKLYFIHYGAKDVTLVCSAVVSGYVFRDKNADGYMNTGDVYLSGAVVRLYTDGVLFGTCESTNGV